MFFNKALGLFAATLLANSPLSAASPVISFPKRATTGYENAVYFGSSDIYNNYNVSMLPVSKISTVVYAFTNVTVEGKV
jgi:GH18 family chitinase